MIVTVVSQGSIRQEQGNPFVTRVRRENLVTGKHLLALHVGAERGQVLQRQLVHPVLLGGGQAMEQVHVLIVLRGRLLCPRGPQHVWHVQQGNIVKI